MFIDVPVPPFSGDKEITPGKTPIGMEASGGNPRGKSALTKYTPLGTRGITKVVPEGIAPSKLVVISKEGSSPSIEPFRLLSNQTAPLVLPGKPKPITSTLSPTTHLEGVTFR